MPKITKTGMVTDDAGNRLVKLIDAAQSETFSFEGQDVIILRLYLQTDLPLGRSSTTCDDIDASAVHQFALPPATARRIVALLSKALQHHEGSDADPLQ